MEIDCYIIVGYLHSGLTTAAIKEYCNICTM